jgi:AcrR family transcriptional regulator
MGSKERRERERQDVRQQILAAARALAAAEGWQAVTIRKVADAVEYSPPTIYEYFASKEAILLALLRLGFRTLVDAMAAARDAATDPNAALLAVARAYWAFAWQYPELYQVMHGMGGVPFCPDDTPPEAEEGFLLVAGILDAMAARTGIPVQDPDGAVHLIWATLHGLVSLAMAGRLDGDASWAAALVDRAIAGMIIVWTTRNTDPLTPNP